jgi:hypothetical protein
MLQDIIKNKVCFRWDVKTEVKDASGNPVERIFEGHFYLDNDTPTEVVKEMLFQYGKYIGQIEDMVKEKQKAEEAAKSAAVIEPAEDKIEPISG